MNREQKELSNELKARLRFEMTLAEISTGFINMPADRVDHAIEDAMRRICESLEIDLAALWQFSDETPGSFILTHLYSAQEGLQPSRQLHQEDFPWIAQQLQAGRIVAISSLEKLPAEAARDRESSRQLGIKSNVTLPLAVGGATPFGVLGLNTIGVEREWSDTMIKQLQLVAQVFSNALGRQKSHKELLTAFVEIERLKEKLEAENIYLREDIKMERNVDEIIGKSDGLQYILFRMEQVAGTDATVLVLGETGTGKGVLAHAIHGRSIRKDFPMITVNCAALPANLIESELFGREKGAFTGAHTRQMGRFEVADKGTIFLDEIGELPLELQAKLLRVIQDGEFERLGSPHTIKVNVRIIASTSRNLKEEIARGRFREDLYYRLNVFPITIPPLRQRQDDIPLLVDHFVKKINRKIGRDITSVPKETMKALQNYSWPGNIRELEHVIERAVITTEGHVLRLAEKVDDTKMLARNADRLSITDVEREHILKVLNETNWRIEGHKGAATFLGLNPSTLRSRMQKLGIHRSDRSSFNN